MQYVYLLVTLNTTVVGVDFDKHLLILDEGMTFVYRSGLCKRKTKRYLIEVLKRKVFILTSPWHKSLAAVSENLR